MLQGNLDIATRASISGWAIDTEAPQLRVPLLVTANDTLVARVVARNWREDLQTSGIGDGNHSFTLTPGAALAAPIRYVVSVRRESDGTPLSGSPVIIEAPTQFDEAARGGFATWLEAAESGEELEQRVEYLHMLGERLLQRRADQVSRRLERSRHRFAWRAGLAGRTSRHSPGLAKRALVIDEKIPRASHDAGSNVILSHLQALLRLGYEVVFASADLRPEHADAVVSLGIEVYAAPWHSSVEDILRREAEGFDLVYLHRIGVAARYLPLVRYYQRRARVVFSVADLSHLRLDRRARLEDRPDLLAVSRSRRAGELATAAAADAVITHSTFEADLLREAGVPDARIHRVLWAAEPMPVRNPWGARFGVAFIGLYAHAPNEDAAIWLVEQVMPLVWERDRLIVCVLAGSEMTPRVRALARPGVEVVGHVKDLRSVLERSRLTVAPLRYGAGVKGKVVDSLASGVPCACTSIAVEGLGLPPPLDAGFDTAVSLAGRIWQLHNDEAASRAASEAGLAYVRTQFSPSHLDAALQTALAIEGDAFDRVMG